MTAAWIVLFGAWLVGVIGIVFSELFWGGSMKQRIATGIAAATLLGAMLYALSIFADKLTAPAHADSAEQPFKITQNQLPNGDCNISGSTIGGSVNNNCNNTINEAPPPQFKYVTEAKIIDRKDGSFDRYFTFEIIAKTAPGTLVVSVAGDNVNAVSINPLTQGTVSTGEWTKGNTHYVRIQSPFGQYQITVNTKDTKGTVDFEYGFNQ